MTNLPPFYIGQKVIALSEFVAYKKNGFNTPKINTVYTVRTIELLEGDNGMIWCIRLSEVKNEVRTFTGGVVGEVAWSSRQFIEVEMVSAKMELKEVMTKFNELVHAN